MIDVLSVGEWLELMRPKYLTIYDIQTLNDKDTIKLLCIDRNFYDLIGDETLAPELFFKDNYKMNYTHKDYLNGTIYFDDDDDVNTGTPFEFHVNWNNRWYPLHEGKLSMEGQSFLGEEAPVEIENYPADTLIGWRGPVLLWEDVVSSPFRISM